jgi:hypothetical protein
MHSYVGKNFILVKSGCYRFITTVAGRTWLDIASIYFSCNKTLSAWSRSSDAVSVGYAKEVKGLTQEISHKAQEVGAMSHLHDKEETLLSSLHRSSERNQ